MRFKLIVVILILLVTAQASGQKIRFTDKRNKWYTRGNDNACFYNTLYFYLEGDTTISSLTYKRLESMAAVSGGAGCDGHVGKTFFVREDTAVHKVYIRLDTAEEVLYNYNLNQGDSFFALSFSAFPIIDTVVTIDFVTINGVSHKVQQALCVYPGDRAYTVVEGVGSLSGPLFTRGGHCFERDEELVCFMQDTVGPHFFSHRLACWGADTFNNSASCATLSVPHVALVADNLDVYPSPANETVKVAGLLEGSPNFIKVFDLSGAKVYEAMSERGELNIDCARWVNGIYLIVVSDGGDVRVKKVVVVH